MLPYGGAATEEAHDTRPILDALAGLSLFADLERPQLEAVAHTFTEESFPAGQRILRQGFTGTGFYVILDGEVACASTARSISRLGKGDFFGEISILLGEPPVADIVALTPAPGAPPGGPDLQRLPAASTRTVMYRMLQSVSRRLVARQSRADAKRARCRTQPGPSDPRGRFPPGDYPASSSSAAGRAGSRRPTSCSRLGIEHAVISADPVPGGMFRRFPFFQRLLSWTKPYAGLARDAREYEWYDWNSLLAVEPEHRALMPTSWTARRRSRRGRRWRRAWRRFAERTGVRVRYDTRWEGTVARRRAVRAPHAATATTAAASPIFAVGVAEPYMPDTPGSSTSPTTSTRARRPVLRRQAAVHRRQAELGLRARARPAPVGERHHPRLAAAGPAVGQHRTRWRASGRATCSRGRTPTWAAACSSSTPRSSARARAAAASASTAAARTTARPFVGGGRRGHRRDRASSVRCATCRPLGVAIFGRSRLPDDDQPLRERHRARHLLRGHHRPGRGGPARSTAIPANSGAVHGARYNVRLMVDAVAERHFGRAPAAARGRPAALVDVPPRRSSPRAPELWNQKSYLARAVSRDPDGRIRDEGIVLARRVRGRGGPDGVAITVETDDTGDIHPAVYVREARPRRRRRRRSTATPLHDYRRRRSSAGSGRARRRRARAEAGSAPWTSASLARRVTATASTSASSRRDGDAVVVDARTCPGRWPRWFVDDDAARDRAAVEIAAIGLLHELAHRAMAVERRPTRPAVGRWRRALRGARLRLGRNERRTVPRRLRGRVPVAAGLPR